MHYARTSDGKQVAATDTDAKRGRYCPACGGLVSLVSAEDKIKHFRHQPNSASADCPLYNPHDGYWTGPYIGANYDRPIPPWSDNELVVTYPEKRKNETTSPYSFNLLFLTRKLLKFGIPLIVLSVIGSQAVTALQTGIAQIDWGGLFLQCIGWIIIIIAVVMAISVLGGLIMGAIILAGVLLGFVLACGVVTSIVFHWPWTF
ncbi:MAG: competence protein CoiA [Anaerolineae bacterium]|nr:competence protein CoiA [Anaerolineae bacterium]